MIIQLCWISTNCNVLHETARTALVHVNLHWLEGPCIFQIQFHLIQLKLNWLGSNCIELHWIALNCIELQGIELNCMGWDWIELHGIALSCIELGWRQGSIRARRQKCTWWPIIAPALALYTPTHYHDNTDEDDVAFLCRWWQIWRGWRWRMTWRLDALGWPITPASPASSWPRYAKDLSYMPHLSFSHDIEHIPICLLTIITCCQKVCHNVLYFGLWPQGGVMLNWVDPILSLINENTMWSTISRFNDIDPEPWLQRCWCPQG